MMLLSLTCDNPNFKNLNFNNDLSVVVGVSLSKKQKTLQTELEKA